MTNYSELTKAQLIELLEKANAQRGSNRKAEVLALLEQGFDTIEAIAEELNMTKKNVSSVLTGLRKAGHVIITLKVSGQTILKLMTADQVAELTK